MSVELESMWDAMKGVHYQRTIDQLERSIRNTKHLEDALTAALDTVVEVIHAQAGTFWFYDQFGDGRIRPKAVFGGGDLKGFSLLPGEGIAGKVIQTGSPEIISDCQKDPRWAGKADAKTGFRTESMICVPLSLKKVVFGCIQVINRTDKMLFDERDLAFLEQLADATAELFRKQGLLDDYMANVAFPEDDRPPEISFVQIFSAEDAQEMERQLRKVDAFAALRVGEQDAVLRLARQMWAFFGGKKERFGRRNPWNR